MTVYQVWSFDSMASNWGEWSPGEVYRLKEKADAAAKKINDSMDQWYKDQGRKRPEYTGDLAYVKEIDVLE